jgi:Integrase core domain
MTQAERQHLPEISRKKPCVKNRVEAHIEQAAVDLAIEQPAYGQVRVSNELKKQGILVSPGGVRSIWLRHDLETFAKRLKGLEAKSAQDNLVLTEAQLQALEKALAREGSPRRDRDRTSRLSGVSRHLLRWHDQRGRTHLSADIYRHLLPSGDRKLYETNTALTAADLLNDRVMPFFESQDVPLLRILTDRGSEYCGNVAHHEYQLYLAIEDIDHTRTKVKSPQTNGICERFHRTILEEFYQIAFRKKIYKSVEQLQQDVDDWIDSYNCTRSHSGRYCYGKTPMQTFLDSKQIVQQKMLARQFEDTIEEDGAPEVKYGEKRETNQTHLTAFLSVR